MRRVILLSGLSLAVAACVQPSPSTDFPAQSFANFTGGQSHYRLAPGDELEISLVGAPELNRVTQIGPDGRIKLPLLPAVMAADRTLEELEQTLSSAYASELRNPRVDVSPRAFADRQVFISGEVLNPGVYAMPGEIDVLQAVAMAGGFDTTARRGEVLVMRRGRDGEVYLKVVDVIEGLEDPTKSPNFRLERMDVVFIPRKPISDWNLFVRQYIRAALPVEFSLFYDLEFQLGHLT